MRAADLIPFAVSGDDPCIASSSGGDPICLFDLQRDTTPSPFDHVASVEASALVARHVDALPDRERAVIRLRFGLDDRMKDGIYGMPTLDSIGKVLGLSRERVRQIEEVALYRLGESLRAVIGGPQRRRDRVHCRTCNRIKAVSSFAVERGRPARQCVSCQQQAVVNRERMRRRRVKKSDAGIQHGSGS